MVIGTALRAGIGGSGNGEEERAPMPRRALDPDASSMRLDDTPGDGESETGATTPRPGRLPEAVEDPRQVVGGDAAARIGDPEDDPLIRRGRASRDPAACRRELDRVANEVLEDLQQSI